MNAPDRTAWLAERRTGIGGSDIAALLGLSPNKTPLQLWLNKTGRADDAPTDPDAEERMHWGTVLEDVVARHYAERRDVRVQRINDTLRHPDVNIALANIDRAVLEPGSRARWDDKAGRVLGACRLLEVKTAHALARNGAEWGNPGSDEVPQAYWLQCQWYLGISGLPFADLAVLFGGQKFVEYTIPADATLFADLLDEAHGWWQRHVVADTPPEPRTEDDARRLWKSHIAGREKIVDATVAEACVALAAARTTMKAIEQEEQRQRDIVCSAFGEAEAISYMGRKLATWKANKDSQKTDWRSVADDLRNAVSMDADDPVFRVAVARNTTTTEGARVLRLNTKEL